MPAEKCIQLTGLVDKKLTNKPMHGSINMGNLGCSQLKNELQSTRRKGIQQGILRVNYFKALVPLWK